MNASTSYSSLQSQQRQSYTNRRPVNNVEPGSNSYHQLDTDFIATDDILISKIGIPEIILASAFQLDDTVLARGGTLSNQYPVPKGYSLDEYKMHLIETSSVYLAEAEVNPPAVCDPSQKNRLVENMISYYMSVQLYPYEMDNVQRDAKSGLRCVKMTDSNGTSFKANYYHQQKTGNLLKTDSSAMPLQQRRVAELPRLPPPNNLCPAIASKLESAARGQRNVIIRMPLSVSPIKFPRPLSPDTLRYIAQNSAKNPRRTVANITPVEQVTPPPPTSIDFPFPMVMVKQEPSDEVDCTPIEVPVIIPTPVNNKQPRKQNLQTRSQCEMELEKVNPENVVHLQIASGETRSGPRDQPMVRKIAQRQPPNDFVTVTIKDADSKSKNDGESSASTSSTIPRDTLMASIPSTSKAPPPAGRCPFKKRPLVTHYRDQTGPNPKRIANHPLETIEILDSSGDEKEANGSSTGTATAPESEVEETPKPKLPGNTESIQCSFCCKVFFSSHLLTLHVQNCADAVLFESKSTAKKQSSDNSGTSSSNKGESSHKPAPETSGKSTAKQDPTKNEDKQKSSTESKPKRILDAQLSIEILPSAFSIDNLLLCEICEKTFRSQEHLDVHQKIHKSPTACKYCKKKFFEIPRKHFCQEMKRAKQRKTI